MAAKLFNQREKISAPPFVTVSVQDGETKRNIFKILAKLRKFEMEEKILIFSSEAELLKGFVIRKGTQLRLEKALMFTRRILTLVLRWKSNACWNDYLKFQNSFESDDEEMKSSRKSEKGQCEGRRDKSSTKDIRIPSRQWANYVTYLMLRDLLLLSKIKYECERTVGYWLGMISCSHHPSDSLIIVGILSRIWNVSSGMVEEYGNGIYPCLCYISSLLRPTQAENWLQDIDFPNDLFTWMESILGFPFAPAVIGNSDHIFKLENGERGGKKRQSVPNSTVNRMDKVLDGAFKSSSIPNQTDKRHSVESASASNPTKSLVMGLGHDKEEDEEEDLGEPVVTTQQQQPLTTKKKGNGGKGKKKKQTNKKLCLDKRWTKFFKNFNKSKLDTEGNRKKLLVRIKKYKNAESDMQTRAKLIKLRKFLRQGKQDDVLLFLPKFKKFLAKRSVQL